MFGRSWGGPARRNVNRLCTQYRRMSVWTVRRPSNLTSNPFDSGALTLKPSAQTDWPVIFSKPEVGNAHSDFVACPTH
jgi:hypothetical protein